MLRLLPLLLLALAVSACDSDPVYVECPGAADCPEPPSTFDPSTVDYDTVESLNYDAVIRPLLETRNPFGYSSIGSSYDFRRLLESRAGATLIPFDGVASPLIRLATQELAPGVANPYPNIADFEDDEVRLLVRWIEGGAVGPSGQPAYVGSRRLLYVCNQLTGRVAIVDVDLQRVIRHVYFEELGQPANAKPHHVVADGRVWYVTLIDGDGGGSVLKLNGALSIDPGDRDNMILAQETPTAGEETFQKPGMLALDRGRGRLYAGRSFSADASSSNLAAFGDLDALTYDEFETGPIHPHAVGVSADGRFVYTAALTSVGGETEVFVLDADTGDRVQRLALPGQLAFVHFAVAQDVVALTSQTDDALYLFDVAPDGTLAFRTAVPVGGQPWHVSLSPDGATAYVPNRTSNTVSVVDVAAGEVAETLRNSYFSQPHGTAVSADGGLLFVSSRNLGMTGSATWMPTLRFVVDGQEEPADLYGNVAIINLRDVGSGFDGVVQQGRFASGVAYIER